MKTVPEDLTVAVQRTEVFSEGGTTRNEDRASYVPGAAWVLDGTSPLGAEPGWPELTSEWLVARWDEYFRQIVPGSDQSLDAIVRRGIPSIGDRVLQAMAAEGRERWLMPGACVALVRLRRDTLEYFILGDCYLVVEDDAGLSMHTDPRVVNLDRLAIDELERSLAAGQMDFQSNREALLQILNRHRALQNRPGGYWLLGTEVEAVEHAIRGTCELDRTRSVLLMTDGFAELSSTFRVTERVADLLPLAREQGLGALHQQLKDLARADWECRAYPRLKRLDDASAVLLEFAPREDEGDSREST